MDPVRYRVSRRRPLLLLFTVALGSLPFMATELAAPQAAHASSAYETAVLADSPAAYYRLNESSGSTMSDDSGNSLNGTYAGSGVTYSATGATPTDSDSAVTLNGSGGGASVADASGFDPTSALTLEAWIKPTSFSGEPTVVAKTNSSIAQYGMWIYDTGGNPDGISMYVDIGGTDHYITVTNTGWKYNVWNQLVGTYDGSHFRLYVNARMVGQQAQTGSISTLTNSFGIGKEPTSWGDPSFTGGIDEVAVYDTALSAGRIAAHFQASANAGSTPSTSTPYPQSVLADSPGGYWRLSEASGLTAHDGSGNGLSGSYSMSGVTQDAAGAMTTDSDGSATLDGSSGDINVPDSANLDPTSHLTIEAWVYPTTFTGEPTIVAKADPASSIEQYGMWLGDTSPYQDSLIMYVDIGGNAYYIRKVNSGWTYNHWNQVVGTYDGSNLRLYVNGQLVDTQAQTGSLSTDSNMSVNIGSDPASGTSGVRFTGGIDDLSIYSSALSAARITSHYLSSGNTAHPTNGALTAAEAPCSCSLGQAGDPVNPESGNYYESVTDVNIPGPSNDFPLAIKRTYSSQSASTNGPFGYGWTYNDGMSLATTGTSPNEVTTITEADGSQVPFDQPASGNVWTPASASISTLTYNSGSSTWTFVVGGRDTYTFDSSGQVTQEEDLNGYTTSFTYTSGNLTTITDSDSRTLTLSWTGSNITTVTDSNVSGNTRTVTYGYTSGNLTSVTDLNGGITDMKYDGSHQLTLLRSANFHANGALGTAPSTCSSTPVSDAVNNHYDGSGRVDCQWDPSGNKTTLSYSGTPQTAAGGTTTITDPASDEVQDGYQWGVRTYETRGYGSAVAATTYFMYDPATLALTGTMDPNGNVTSYTVDSSGNVLTKTDPLGRVTTSTYNGFNEPLTVEDGNGVTTTNTYDVSGNPLTTSTPLTGTAATATNCKSPSTAVAMAQVTCFTYGNGTFPGAVTQMTDPDGNNTYYHQDANGYTDEVKDPAGHVTGTIRNNDGWVTATYSAKAGCTWNSSPPTGCSSSYETQYDYSIVGGSGTDEFGDVGTVTDPLSHTTKTTYDADRNKLTVEDGNGNTSQYAYDANDRQCWVLPGATSGNSCSSPPTNARVTDYNSDNTVADQKDGKGNAILTFGYNALKQVTSTEDASGHTTYYTVDGDGNVLSKEDPVSGATCTGTKVGCTNYTWDGDNELKTVSYSDSSSENVTGTTYDNDGQRTAMTDGTGSSSWSLDSLHRLTSYTNGNGATVTYGYTYGGGPTYDMKNQVRSIAYPNSVGTVDQSWNADGTLASVTDWNSKTITFGFDSNLNETSQTVPSTTNVTDTFGLNAANQMTSVSDSNGTVLFSATYTRDSNGQLATDNSVNSNQGSYKYTALNQLCYAGSSSTNACGSPPASSYPYAFDNADNLTTNNGNAQQYNSADQLCWTVSGSSANACGSVPGSATTYGFNNQGDRTDSVTSANGGACYTYDQPNRLTKIQVGTGSSCTSPSTLGTYGYDGDGIRESKTVSGTTTQFTWDGVGGNLLQQYDGTTKTSFIYGPDGIPVEQIAGSTVTYDHHDQLGSIRLITDSAGATGTATTQTWDPYGNSVSTSGSLTSPFGFSGQYTDAESGLIYLRARYYDPSTSQFLTVDPKVSSTMSPYAYVAGNPLNDVDPTGTCAVGLASCPDKSPPPQTQHYTATEYLTVKDPFRVPLASEWLTVNWDSNGSSISNITASVLTQGHDGHLLFGQWNLTADSLSLSGCTVTANASLTNGGGAFDLGGMYANDLSLSMTLRPNGGWSDNGESDEANNFAGTFVQDYGAWSGGPSNGGSGQTPT